MNDGSFVAESLRMLERLDKRNKEIENHMLYMDGNNMLKKKKARKSPVKRSVVTESHEQQLVAQYLDSMGYLWCHVPNEGQRSIAFASRLKREGVKRGVPDILIFAPKRIAIELKKNRKARPTLEQLDWIKTLRKNGWKSAICYGAAHAIEFIKHAVECSREDCQDKDHGGDILREWYPPEQAARLVLESSPLERIFIGKSE